MSNKIKEVTVITFSLLIIPIFSTTLFAQHNKINFPLRTWKSKETREKEQQKLVKWENNWDKYSAQKKKISSIIIMSAVLPGLGQIKCNDWRKGSLFLGSTTLTFGSALYFFSQSNDKYKEYKTADNIDAIEKHWDAYSKALQYSQISALLGTGIWIVNLIDTYFTTKSYNSKILYENFYSNRTTWKPTIKVSLNNNKLNFSFAWKF